MRYRAIPNILSAICAGALVAACSDRSAPPAGPENEATATPPAFAVELPAPFTARGRIDPYFINQAPDLMLRSSVTSDLAIQRLVTDPSVGGWHTHPGPSLITVTVGEITAYDGHDPLCSSRVYRAGETFVDGGGDHVHLLRNETSAPAETVAVQFLPEGATRRIDAPEPNNCKF